MTASLRDQLNLNADLVQNENFIKYWHGGFAYSEYANIDRITPYLKGYSLDSGLFPDIIGSSDNDILDIAGSGVAWGLEGDDVFYASQDGLNILVGGSGDDTFVLPYGSTSIIYGNKGFDRLIVPSFSPVEIIYRINYINDDMYGFYQPSTNIFALGNSEILISASNDYSATMPGLYVSTHSNIVGIDDYNLPNSVIEKLELLRESEDYELSDFEQASADIDSSSHLDALNSYIQSADAFLSIFSDEILPASEISVTLEEESLTVEAFKPIQLPVRYENNSQQPTITGLSTNIHFDSSILKPHPDLEESEIFLPNVSLEDDADVLFESTLLDDAEDSDSNPSTDKILNLTWADLSPDSEGIEMPDVLGDLVFAAVVQPVDSVTGMPLTTTVNIIPVEVPSNYQSVSSTTDVFFGELPYSLDVDGDGIATALGDGLMIIRKLFNYAFTGDKLTDKAISPNATRSTEEIHVYLEDGIANGFLDIDKDGSTTALGDGLMIIRYLFGAAFEGESLTSKALSNTSPFYDEPMAWSLVAEQIESLVPASPTL